MSAGAAATIQPLYKARKSANYQKKRRHNRRTRPKGRKYKVSGEAVNANEKPQKSLFFGGYPPKPKAE